MAEEDLIIALPVRFVLMTNGTRYAINEQTGDPEPRSTRSRKAPEVKIVDLQSRLMSIGATKKSDERGELADFFNTCGYWRAVTDGNGKKHYRANWRLSLIHI